MTHIPLGTSFKKLSSSLCALYTLGSVYLSSDGSSVDCSWLARLFFMCSSRAVTVYGHSAVCMHLCLRVKPPGREVLLEVLPCHASCRMGKVGRERSDKSESLHSCPSCRCVVSKKAVDEGSIYAPWSSHRSEVEASTEIPDISSKSWRVAALVSELSSVRPSSAMVS